MSSDGGRKAIINGYAGVWHVEAVMGDKLVLRLDGHRVTADRKDVFFLDGDP